MSQEATFSVVLPVKDETSLLMYSLPSIYALEPDELVIPVEPYKPSLDAIGRVARRFPKTKTRILMLTEPSKDWMFRQAYARRLGFTKTRNDLILTVDSDIIVDPAVRDWLRHIGSGGVGLVSFGKLPLPATWPRMIGRLLGLIKRTGFTGVYAFSKRRWLETECQRSLKKLQRGEDTHLHEAMSRKYATLFVAATRNLVLRPHESSRYLYLMGLNRWRIRKQGLIRTVIGSLIRLQPQMLVGYLKARLGDDT